MEFQEFEKPKETNHRAVINFFLASLDILKLALIAFVVVWPIHHFLVQPFLVRGSSMEPNFYENDYLLIDELSFRFEPAKRGEVVIVRSPRNKKEYLIKRVIGMPGERIVIKGGKVYIYNDRYVGGTEVSEVYLPKEIVTPNTIDIQLDRDEYFVLGDNRSVSLDSRSFGPIERSSLVGRVLVRGFPFNKIGRPDVPMYEIDQ